MRIEVTQVLELDTALERQRIQTCFEGKEQSLLLSILDRFEKGQFQALAEEAPHWPEGTAQYLHSVVYDVLKDTRQRLQLHAGLQALTEAGKPMEDRHADARAEMGLPPLTVQAKYPRYAVVVSADGNPVFQNPNDVRVQHNYALHVLNSVADGLVKADTLLADVDNALAGTPHGAALAARVMHHRLAQERLLASARHVLAQLAE